MGILSRISKVLESNLNALVEKAEDPQKMLDQAIGDMKKGREEAREAIIEAKTQKKLLERKRDKAAAESASLEAKAMAALKGGDESLARRCLEMKITAENRAETEASAAAEQEAQIKQLEVAEREIERRLSEAPAKKAALMARQSAAAAKGARVGATSKASTSVGAALEAFDRMEEKVIRAEVEAEVIGEGNPEFVDMSSIDDMKADAALVALKAKMAAQIPANVGETPPPPEEKAQEPDPVGDSLAALKEKLGEDG